MNRDLARQAPQIFLAPYKSVRSLQIRFSDVDRLGHVNNSVHQQFFDLGRLHYFDGLLDPVPDWEGVVIILAHLEIDFLQPIFLHSEVCIYTRTLLTFSEKAFTMQQAIASPDGQQIYTISESLMVGYDAAAQASIKLPTAWVAQIEAFEN